MRTFRKMFLCLRRSDRRESDGMGHVICSITKAVICSITKAEACQSMCAAMNVFFH